MGESLRELVTEAHSALVVARDAIHAHDWQTAREATRAVLSAGSKLHSRLGVLAELREDAEAAAEVDRALSRLKQLDGQMTTEDVIPHPPEKDPRPPRRKGKPS